MATYDFRVLLETVEGRKFSYYSSSFVNTADNLVLSSSQVYDRITGSVSCSYQNTNAFSSSMPTSFSHTDLNKNYTFKNNTYLSASLTGSFESGSIIFQEPENIAYDKLLRYKFVGSEKVCNVLGLPSNTWVYVDQFRLPADDEANYFEGNIKAKNLYVEDSITIANTSTLNSDIPVLIDTGSDRYIKFVDVRGVPENALMMGYDKDDDVYEISASNSKIFNIGGVDNATINTGSFTYINMRQNTTQMGTFQYGLSTADEKTMRIFQTSNAPVIALPHQGRIEITGSIDYWESDKQQRLSMQFHQSDGLVFRSNIGSTNPALIISGGNSGFGVDGGDITEKVQVDGNISASGQYYGEQIIVTHHMSDIDATSEVNIPAPSYFVDAAASNYTTRWIAPYDGELEKILVNSNATPGSTVMTLYAGVDAADKKDSVTVNLNNANRTFTFNCTSGSTISSGDLVRIGYNASADSDQVSFTCIWKYKII